MKFYAKTTYPLSDKGLFWSFLYSMLSSINATEHTVAFDTSASVGGAT